ncbi:hypothetical protein [Allokutzneria albata]|uniref:Uncharacterized protein n=1 Tax=Allokutzneria albata TaxID=211114 RepID=A0A1H0CE81_ALLAB|nr:hypothetical protein [Allokutzneria albata]SDN56228.1 hypothetical protein SAMN04489726_7178 [Allokutzneria albata]
MHESPAQESAAQQRPRLPFPVWSLTTATAVAVAVVLGVALTDQFSSTGTPGRDGGALHPREGGEDRRFETNPDGRPMEYQPGRTTVTLVPTTTVIHGSTVVTPSPSPIDLPSVVVPSVVLPVPSQIGPTPTTTTARPITTTPTTTATTPATTTQVVQQSR